jgi:ZIP family zinc transporter
MVLAFGQVLADVPEGYAAMANFRDKGVPRRRRLLLSASFILFCVGSALVAFFILRGAGESVKMAALVFVAGLLTVAAVEDMLEEAHEAREDDRGSVLAFVGGFTLFTLVSAGLETVTGGEARASEPIDARIFAGQQTQTMPDAAAFAEGYQNSLLSLLTFQ